MNFNEDFTGWLAFKTLQTNKKLKGKK
jgi:hypothetical protein